MHSTLRARECLFSHPLLFVKKHASRCSIQTIGIFFRSLASNSPLG